MVRSAKDRRNEKVAASLREEIERAGLVGLVTARYLPRERVLRFGVLTSPGVELDYTLQPRLRKALVRQIHELAARADRKAA